MQSFSYYCPTKVVFGECAEARTAAEIRAFGGRRVFLVYGGGSAVRSGLLDRLTRQMSEAGIACETFGGVQPNPRVEHAREGVVKALEFQADFILGVGGGSVLDTAKAIAHGAANPGTDLWDFWLGKARLTRSLPVGAVLTIPAAGSETSDSSVLTDEATGVKRGLSTQLNRPRFAIMDPCLTFTLPKYQVGCGIVDIMMHTMDRYFTPTKGNQLTDRFAEALLRNVIENGRIAIRDAHNYDAMSELMWSGSVSHNGLTGLGAEKDFAPHKLGHELSGKFDVAHGASLSVMWPAWAAHCWKAHPERFVQFGREVWGIEKPTAEEAALAAIEATTDYFRSLDMPVSFTELGIGVQSEEMLLELADRATRGDTIKLGSFLPMDRADALAAYRLANH